MLNDACKNLKQLKKLTYEGSQVLTMLNQENYY